MQLISFWFGIFSASVAILASLSNRSLRFFSREQLELRCARDNRQGRVRDILNNRRNCRMAAELLQVMASIGVVFCLMYMIPADSIPTVYFRLAAIVVTLITIEVWIPRAVSHIWTNTFLYYSWPAIFFLSRVLSPLVFTGRMIDQLFHRLAGLRFGEQDQKPVEGEILAVISEAAREGLLETDAREMIESTIDMRQAEVSKIMTPRTDMTTMPVSATLNEARNLMIEAAHSRVPVHRENRDDIVGILYIRDLLAHVSSIDGNEKCSIESIIRPPFYVPETKSVPALLQEFQRHRIQIAIVLDVYGGVSGLVTIEDVLAEVVGGIEEEYEEIAPDAIQIIGENVVEVDGRVHVDELNERLDLSLPEDGDFDTVGGFVFSQLGRLPTTGEQFDFQTVHFTMIAVGKRKIDRLKLEFTREIEPPNMDPAIE